jgi:hypothetical protein
MTDRVLIGKKGSDYGLWVAEPGGDVLNDTDKEMLLSSNIVGTAQILMFQNISVAANATATQNYLSNGGGKSFFNYWINADYLGGADASNYNSGLGFSGWFISVKNKYVNSTTNQIEVTNVHTSNAYNILVLVVNQAAA